LLSRSFNEEFSRASAALLATYEEIEERGRDRAYAERFEAWRQSHEPLFRRIALAIPGERDLALRILNDGGKFAPSEWPAEWSGMRDQLTARMRGERVPPSDSRSPALFEIPRFGDGPGRMGEQEWLVLELNLDYIRTSLLPDMLKKYVGIYDAEV